MLGLSFTALVHAAVVPFDMAGPGPGSIQVSRGADSVSVAWNDKAGRPCSAAFSLDPATPLIRSIDVNGKTVVSRALPVYRASTGKRRGGWDQFFDFPGSHPDGTRSFIGAFKLTAAHARFDGDQLDISFDGLTLGIFHGSVHYIFFPGSVLIQQRAIVTTNEPDTAFFYDAGLRMTVDEDRRPGFTMDTTVNYYDTAGKLQARAGAACFRVASGGGAVSRAIDRDRRGQHRRVSAAAPVLHGSRLHEQYGVRLVFRPGGEMSRWGSGSFRTITRRITRG